MLRPMGAPRNNIEALRAYDEAMFKYRKARMDLALRRLPESLAVQRVEDAAVILAAAGRSYYDLSDGITREQEEGDFCEH